MELNYQRPRKLEIEELTPTYGRFSAEPFERGYGTTIGIALRRVLLSLIEGTAISAVRIEGVLHEFSTMPGIYEDVLNIILNLRNIPFKLNVEEPRMIRIEKITPGEVVSGDIISDSDVEVLDKNVHIAYLEEGATFRAEILIKKGTGFKLAEQNFDESLPVDFVAVDANFSPIEKVKYTILPARVGKQTDYEKLILEVWTNGSISPQETVSRAGKILRDHLAICLNYQDREKVIAIDEQDIGNGIEGKFDVLERSVESMGLSVRALKCLKKLGVDYIYELIEKTEHELLNSKNFGKKSLEEIIQKLAEYDMILGQKLPESIKSELARKLAKEKEDEDEDNDDLITSKARDHKKERRERQRDEEDDLDDEDDEDDEDDDIDMYDEEDEDETEAKE
ncbi:MAG TPA: DNA-directed RNA polymerase subunit alpha [Candidatus Kapabacteria bacterium]|nr:DNA-directed RNA polymerase subunit alpha [Candidatus Kapabacteria bacterium]